LSLKFDHGVIDNLWSQYFTLKVAKQQIFQVVAANVEIVLAPAAIETPRACILFVPMGSTARGYDQIRAALAALQKPTEQVRTRHGARRKARALWITPCPMKRSKSCADRAPEVSRDNCELGIGGPNPF
jgi:hypothetical protein